MSKAITSQCLLATASPLRDHLKKYYLLSAKKMMMVICSAVLFPGYCSGDSRAALKNLTRLTIYAPLSSLTFRQFLFPKSSLTLFQSFSVQAFGKLELFHITNVKSL